MAHFIAIGEPAHDAERQALRFLAEGLPGNYTVYGNPWLVERSGVIYELDAVVAAPHALFIVEIKAYRGRIVGTDHDWYNPSPLRSPLQLNRLTAQVLRSQLKRESFQAGQAWVEGLVFLSATTDVNVKGTASRDRVHTKKTILSALQDPALVQRLSSRTNLADTAEAEKKLVDLLLGAQRGPKPARRIREYEIVEALDHQDTFTELFGRHNITHAERVLRIYTVPTLANDAQRAVIHERARWESQVLGRLGRLEGVLAADPPFDDEAGIVLPLERFAGITLTSWIERYVARAGATKAELGARCGLWLKLAQTIDDAHQQGVVHRLLRPEVVLVDDAAEPSQLRVTGFDLAKQRTIDATVHVTTLSDERLSVAAPEVITHFSSAEPASDQFSLGAILAMLLTGRPLFESTRQLMVAGRLLRRVRDLDQRVPLSLDEAVSRMVSLRPPDRFESLAQAIRAVRVALEPESPHLPGLAPRAPLNADDLQAGARVGADYEVLSRLGQGGMAVVYAARHTVSGRTRALKIARSDNNAEDALRAEYQALSALDHPNIVRVIQWMASHPNPEPNTLRRLAEDLLAGLEYLEQKGITHKDLKPDNLLVADGRLTLIDFSLAGVPADATYGGTALYRDPASRHWTHATDRYAAALCLFELYAGRHAFDGRVPEPGQSPLVGADDIDPPGLAKLFAKALAPVPEQRFPSARAMRDALVLALGDDAPAAAPAERPPIDERTPLRLSGLSWRAVRALERCRVKVAGELVSLSPAQIHALHAIGTKNAAEVIAVREALIAQGVSATGPTGAQGDPALVDELIDSPEPVEKLPMPAALRTALDKAGLRTVGAVARLTRDELLRVPGIGRSRLSAVVEALHQFQHHTPAESTEPRTLDRFWELASRPLSDAQREAVARTVGLTGEPETQSAIADDLGRSQSRISIAAHEGLDRIDRSMLGQLEADLDILLDGFGGVVSLHELGARLEEAWPAGDVTGAGFVRLLVRFSAGRAHLVELDALPGWVVARATVHRDDLVAFTAELLRLASQWPPVEPEAARRALSALLPHYPADPLVLGVRLCSDVELSSAGHLFVAPLEPRQSVGFVLDRAREPLSLAELADRVRELFGASTPYPEPDHLLGLLRELDCRVHGDLITPGHSASLRAAPPSPADALPSALVSERSPEVVVRDMLRDAARSRGFRMLVTPPEHHREIGRSVAAALGGAWLSFDDAFFADHAHDLPALERAERFIGQRDALTEAAEATLFRLLDEHGQPGRVLVLGDTALFGLCEATDLPRRLYDEALSGSRGFWVLVVPGVILNRQPRFNEGPPFWHLEGATMPLLHPMPA
jgi:serine/threonine protein kinase